LAHFVNSLTDTDGADASIVASNCRHFLWQHNGKQRKILKEQPIGSSVTKGAPRCQRTVNNRVVGCAGEGEPMRFDIYRPIHKALRLALSNLLIKLGSTDFQDEAAATEAIGALRQQILLSRSHLHHEEEYIHPLLEARSASASGSLEADHRHHERRLSELEELASAIEWSSPEDRSKLGQMLYLQFSRFVAEDFVHMAEEETETLSLLHLHYEDRELQEIEGRIVAAQPPEKLMHTVSLMVPAMNLPERVAFLRGIKASAPPEAFEALISVAAKPSLPTQAWELVEEKLREAA
jgi:hypothetical protein